MKNPTRKIRASLLGDAAGSPVTDMQESIRRRAYEIWEQSGRPNGSHLDHWLQAELEHSAAQPAATARSATSKSRSKQRPLRDRQAHPGNSAAKP